MAKTIILDVKDLKISFGTKKKYTPVVHNSSFQIFENEILAIVGESGSGKSVTSLAIMGLLSLKQSKIEGTINFNGKELTNLKPRAYKNIRGSEVAMIFQEPMSALNPSIRCGFQVAEMLQNHTTLTTRAIKKEVLSLFNKVKLPNPTEIFSRYPHQLSGGQMQRVMIAMAIACKPKLLIADEPTTALDVTVQKEILELLKELQKETKMSLLFISHDLSLVSEIADRVLVMNQGNIVENGTVLQVFKTPKNEYTKALLASRPTLGERLEKLPTIAAIADGSFQPRIINSHERGARHRKLYTTTPILSVRNVEKAYYTKGGIFGKKSAFKAVDDVSFEAYEGETVGLVGESGCGKSTLGRVILKLDSATAGTILYRGQDISKLSTSETRKLRKEIQLIFQDPFSSLNPRLTIGEAILEPMLVHNIGINKKERKQRVQNLLTRVGLDASYFNRYPHQLSGGQRQRVGIARTIAMEPKLIVCDESVSALDISVQAQVLNLLNELKDNFGFTYIFISHDLAVVKYMADQLLVMNAGKFEEVGDADEIYAHPRAAYTKRLIDAIPKGI